MDFASKIMGLNQVGAIWTHIQSLPQDFSNLSAEKKAALIFIGGLIVHKASKTYKSNITNKQGETKMDLVKGALGSEANFDLKMEAGQLILTVSYKGSEASASLSAGVEPGLFLDKLKALIPGQVDDAVIEIIKMALKAV